MKFRCLTVDFRARVDDALSVVREAREMHAILLALQLFGVLPLFAVIDLEGVIVAGYDGQFACVVKVERRHRSLGIIGSEALDKMARSIKISQRAGMYKNAYPRRTEACNYIANFLGWRCTVGGGGC